MTFDAASTDIEWVSLTVSQGTCFYAVVDGWVQLRIAGDPVSIPDGVTTLGTGIIPADMRPSYTVRAFAYLGGNTPTGTLAVASNGNVNVRQGTGVTQTLIEAQAAWPVE